MAANQGGPGAVAERREKAIRLRAQGTPWARIAAELGYADAPSACTDVRRALEQRNKQLALAADEYREQALATLDAMAGEVWAVLQARHLTIQNGRVVRDDDDAPVLDDGPVLSAVDRLLRIEERRARLLGIDAPSQVTGTVVNYTVDGVPPDALT